MDIQIKKLINKEIVRQAGTLDLIPSQNIADPEMLGILGSPLTNVYSEGYAGRRYYPGNTHIDEIETLAQKRAREAFGLSEHAWEVNVQPYSGSPANLAIYQALMKPGEVLMGLKLSHGGHLTHGHQVNASGMSYRAVPYTITEEGLIDYEALALLAKKHAPRVIVSGATAYARIIDFKKIGEIAKEVGAYHLADISHIAGLVAAGAHPSPFPYADVVMTTTHKTLRGPRGAVIFSKKEGLKTGASPLTVAEAIDRAVFPGLQGGPHNNVTAAIAWTFKRVQEASFKKYAFQVVRNAHALGEALMDSGFNLVSHGTENHLMLVNLRGTGISGSEAQALLEKNQISANRNAILDDASPFNPTGLRIGTPAVTARGMKEKEMRSVAELIAQALLHGKNVRPAVARLCKAFPLPYKALR
jgi:glycine hydroxymethyltransferase